MGGGYLNKKTPSELEKFKKENKKQKIIIISLISLILLIGIITFYRTFALYEEKREFNIIRGKVPYYQGETTEDIILATIIDEKKSNTIPKKEEGYEFVSVACDNEAIATWNNETWQITIGNLSKSKTTCTLSFKSRTYKENILNGADPVLADGLIPVIIDETGSVTKANIRHEWYSYEKKNWANAVILEDESITYNDGDVIPEANIESYFVWIPKYSYQLWDLGNYTGLTKMNTSKVHEIPVRFGLTNTSDTKSGECTTPMTSGASGNCKIGDYMTSPAFITMGTNGLWVGKFETGCKGAKSTAEAQINLNDSTKICIKPNVYSWRNIQVSNAFYASYNYKRELDSHMMKNTEWGAVAYLQHSAYGSASSVRINNNNACITGYAGIEEPSLGYNGGTSIEGNRNESTALGVDGTYTINYLNPNSVVASTTGNYTGIYDMSGGAWEYVMGVRNSLTSGKAGFVEKVDSKYYDIYGENPNYISFNYRILGDAIGEMGPFQSMINPDNVNRNRSSWYNDFAHFIHSNKTWISRSEPYHYGVLAGIFAFDNSTGSSNINSSFRLVLNVVG